MVNSFQDEIFSEDELTFKIFGLSVWDTGFEINGTVFGSRDKAGGHRDVAIGLSFERSAVLNLSALGLKGVRFWGSRVVDGENRFGRRFSGDLIVENVETNLIKLMDIPRRFREEVLKFCNYSGTPIIFITI